MCIHHVCRGYKICENVCLRGGGRDDADGREEEEEGWMDAGIQRQSGSEE